jgi:hypothetical protein
MALKLRPTGLGSGIDKDRPITPSAPASGRSVASTRPAEAQFQKSWDAWKAWAKLEELP